MTWRGRSETDPTTHSWHYFEKYPGTLSAHIVSICFGCSAIVRTIKVEYGSPTDLIYHPWNKGGLDDVTPSD